MEYAETGTTVSQVEIEPGEMLAQDFVGSITKRVMDIVKLTGCFSELCPVVRGHRSPLFWKDHRS